MLIRDTTFRGGRIVDGSPVLRLSWPLDNASSWPGSGTTITDLSGNGNNGTLVNSPTTASTSITSVRGSGASNRFISSSYNLSRTWTVHVICNFSSNTTSYWQTLWANESATAGLGWTWYGTSSSLWNIACNGLSSLITISQPDTTKRLYSITYDGTNARYYVNGALSRTSGTATNATTSTTGLYFGARHANDGTSNSDGSDTTFYRMDVWQGAQSGTEITAFYNAIRTQYGI